MTPEQAFLDDIIASPADYTLRLVFADWLEDNGQESRAQFIRVQIALDTAPLVYEIRGQAPRGERIFSGGHAFDERWLRRFLANYLHGFIPTDSFLTFRRGFLHTIRLPLAAWMEHGPALMRAQPLERVELSDKEPFEHSINGDAWWYLSTASEESIPDPIFELLPDGIDGHSAAKGYKDAVSAVDALSAACLAWAREAPA